mmetsp:Transcript_11761/g.50393  ORF Transcript_11761/g.50393 Transcript_11761/m.50393 type:complete len:232 (+) Transcript_11761:1282-1977(+)
MFWTRCAPTPTTPRAPPVKARALCGVCAWTAARVPTGCSCRSRRTRWGCRFRARRTSRPPLWAPRSPPASAPGCGAKRTSSRTLRTTETKTVRCSSPRRTRRPGRRGTPSGRTPSSAVSGWRRRDVSRESSRSRRCFRRLFTKPTCAFVRVVRRTRRTAVERSIRFGRSTGFWKLQTFPEHSIWNTRSRAYEARGARGALVLGAHGYRAEAMGRDVVHARAVPAERARAPR